MNYKLHAKHSAIIFGGKAEDYIPIHATIDGNKVASTSVYGRFFMHHYDAGGMILEKLFGKEIAGVPVKKILLQHLLEDYGQVPLFRDWIRNGGMIPMRYSTVNPSKNVHDEKFMKTQLEGRGLNVSSETIQLIESLLTLSYFTNDKQILERPESPMNCCVFGHATGIYLAEKFLPPQLDGYDTLDILPVYYYNRFQGDGIPTIIDYINDWIIKKPWMLPSNSFDRLDPMKVKEKMNRIILNNNFGIQDIKVFFADSDTGLDHRNCQGTDNYD